MYCLCHRTKPHSSTLSTAYTLAEPAEAEVRFEGVGFRYPGREDQDALLRDVSFTVPAGRKLAIVGPSGSGKSAREGVGLLLVSTGLSRGLLHNTKIVGLLMSIVVLHYCL